MELLTPLVADIVAEGLSLVGEVSAEALGLSESDAVIHGPLSVSLDLTKADDMVAVSGVLEGTVVRQCVRCLNEYDDPLAFSVHAAFAREPKEPRKESRIGGRPSRNLEGRKGRPSGTKTEAEALEDDEQDDRYYYQGDHVDLAPMLREHVILAAPMQPLCREECAGLCSRCGKDLNEGPCQCPPEPQSSRIRVIRTMR
ncbi:MAG TPA: DUF177 domain-containing protein [Nitrospira sp.]|nr:DUF177 domain-containing protein [Nitrospira sp.]